MPKTIIKKGDTGKYFVELAAVFCNENERTPETKSEQRYEGMLLIRQKGFERARYGASTIRVYSQNKNIVVEQLRQIASLYAPKKNIVIVDTEGIGL